MACRRHSWLDHSRNAQAQSRRCRQLFIGVPLSAATRCPAGIAGTPVNMLKHNLDDASLSMLSILITCVWRAPDAGGSSLL
jgi:hypothetical protein